MQTAQSTHFQYQQSRNASSPGVCLSCIAVHRLLPLDILNIIPSHALSAQMILHRLNT